MNDYEATKQRRNLIQKLSREQEELEREIEAIDERLEQLRAEQLKEEVYLDPEKALQVQHRNWGDRTDPTKETRPLGRDYEQLEAENVE